MTNATKQVEPTLSIGDLNAVVQLIDICARRGAFDGKELQSVGSLRARFAAFIQSNTPAEEQENEGSEATSAVVPEIGDPAEPGEG